MEFRALELNSSSSIWNPERIIETLDLMSRVGYNVLVLHEVPVMEELVWPAKFFGAIAEEGGVHRRYREGYKAFYKYNPRRRPTPYHNLDYMRWIARRARERNIDLYLNNKELYFPDAILEFHPELVKNGCVCPSEPFWVEFTETKYDELFTDFPELTGTVTAPGSGESRLAISSSRCTCELCATQSAQEWYTNIISAMHRAATRHQKKLVVRDFVFDHSAQNDLADAMVALDEDITICLKNTPHDYYPTFPDNARIGDVGAHAEWVEFDALGQYFGWGIAPAIMTADLRNRLAFARSKGVTGILVRIDWEGLQGHSALRSMNALNVYASAMLACDQQTTNRQIYELWSSDYSAVRGDLGPVARQEALQWIEDTLEAAWPITSRTLFARDCVFSDSSYIPVSVEHAFWLGEEKNSLRDWDASKWEVLSPTLDNVQIALEEKRVARTLVAELRERVEVGHTGLNPAWHGDLLRRIRTFERYVQLYEVVATAVFGARYLLATGVEADPAVLTATRNSVARLAELAQELRATESTEPYPSVLLLNPQRVDVVREDVEANLVKAGFGDQS
jgi:hypothetical protein